MPTFEIRSFGDFSSQDPFFESLTEDYSDFGEWYDRKSEESQTAYVIYEDGIQAFLYIKEEECEEVGNLPAEKRMKIGTLKISNDLRRKRYGEGAIGLALWKWQQSPFDEIYITVYNKHLDLISLLKSFGFQSSGMKGGECVYVRSKKDIHYETPKSCFPYIDPDFERGGYIPLKEEYHDTFFPDSEIMTIPRSILDFSASNGMMKYYIATPEDYHMDYKQGDILFAYRIHEGEDKTNKSMITAHCTVTEFIPIKENGIRLMTFRDFWKRVGNKAVLSPEELSIKFNKKKNVYAIEMIYNGYFGSENNISHKKLKEEGFLNKHLYEQKLTREQTMKIFRMGGKDEQDIIIDKS